jgi:predicted MPP superfamily phosphohydrolase
MRLLLFVSLVISIYAAMHVLVLWGMHPLLAGRPAVSSLVLAFMVAMIAAPLVVVALERAGREAAARGLAWVAYTWLGLLFLAFSLFSVLGAWESLAWIAARGFPQVPGLSVYGSRTAALVLLVALGAGAYGRFEARRLRVETVHIATPKLMGGREGVRIVQVSDLHLGLLNREEALAPVIARLKELEPDVLVATGDVVDAQINHLDGLSALWRDVDPPLGKFAVTGNHEVYAGLGASLDFLARSGFTVLRNEGRDLGGVISLVGVDDDHAPSPPVDEAALLRAHPRGLFTVLLKHRPALARDSGGLFDLQLSGHTHLGQIFPFRFLTGLRYPMQDGLYDVAGGGRLYTSRGTGTWGPPMRVLAPPEITVFEIGRAAGRR